MFDFFFFYTIVDGFNQNTGIILLLEVLNPEFQ